MKNKIVVLKCEVEEVMKVRGFRLKKLRLTKARIGYNGNEPAQEESYEETAYTLVRVNYNRLRNDFEHKTLLWLRPEQLALLKSLLERSEEVV